MKTLSFFLLTATLACADPLTTPLGRIKLLDGRTLNNAVVRSYDAEASKVLVVSEGKALLIPLSLLPPPFAEKVIADSNRNAPDLVQTTPVPQPAEPPPTGDQNETAPDAETTPIPVPSSPAPVVPSSPRAPAASPVDPISAHEAAAKAHALRYYKYEFTTGSGAIAVTDADIAIEDVVAVPGWSNRYRTTGKIYLEIYDSIGGGSFRRRSNKFEILTEQKPGERIKVVDFTRK